MAEYKAEDYINFIEQGRTDKISPHALIIIAKGYRDLQENTEKMFDHMSKFGDGADNQINNQNK